MGQIPRIPFSVTNMTSKANLQFIVDKLKFILGWGEGDRHFVAIKDGSSFVLCDDYDFSGAVPLFGLWH